GRAGECAPAGCRRPEAAELARADAHPGLCYDSCPGAVIAEPAQREHGAPCRHCSRIVVAAFGLVPGIPFLAVISRANVGDTFDTFTNHPGVKHVGGG